MNLDGRPVGLILDTSALVAYAAWKLAPQEVIGEVWANEEAVGIPLACLIEAITQGADESDLIGLQLEDSVEIIEHYDIHLLAAVTRDLGGHIPRGMAAAAALARDAQLLTAEPWAYAGTAGVLTVTLH